MVYMENCAMDGDELVWKSVVLGLNPKQDGHIQRSCSLE